MTPHSGQRARKATLDFNKTARRAGEEWLYERLGAYMPGVDEEIVETINAYVLTDRKALHVRATRTFTDVTKTERKAGEEWCVGVGAAAASRVARVTTRRARLVTMAQSPTHIPDVYEKVVGEVSLTTLSNRQYWCVRSKPRDGVVHRA